MNILVINCGSSSLKYQLFNMKDESVLAKGLVERIGIEGSVLTQKVEGREDYVIVKELKDHNDAIKLVLEALISKKFGVLTNMDEISAVGHRVVHGGEKYSTSVLIDESVMEALRDYIKLAPLHNPPNIIGIEACKKLMPDVPMVAVFDTAFHQTMPEVAYLYGLPYELYKNHGIRKYGFHGTSHKYVSGKAAEFLNKDIKDLKIITCHLGNGSSIAAIKNGNSIDTSMGFTPLEGLIMGTRSGNIDPAIVTYLIKELNYSVKQIDDLLNKESGVLGISGVSSDFRDLDAASNKGNKRATLALEMFRYNVKKYIGAYTAIMGGIDCLVFTAGLGENSIQTRESICEDLQYLGIEIDRERNNVRGKDAEISTDSSKVKVLVIPTNEELMIARDTEFLSL